MNLDVYSDAVCPWCYIGKARLGKALQVPDEAGNRAGEGVHVYWRAWQLYPEVPAAGMSKDEFNLRRWGTNDRDRIRKGFSRIEQEADAEGLPLRLGAAERMPNTRDAHRLNVLGHRLGVQDAVVDALFDAYFVRGEDIGDLDTLAEIGGRAGLDATDARTFLAQGGGDSEVEGELLAARDMEISSVPSFVFGGVFAIPGAQSAETLALIIARARGKLDAPA